MKTTNPREMRPKTKRTFKSNLNVLFLSLLMITFIGSINSQDIITFKNGGYLNAKVTEISDTDIKCKTSDDPNATRVIKKTEILAINYQNGVREVFLTIDEPNNTPSPATTKSEDDTDFAKIKPKSFGGPRIGATVITDGTISSKLKEGGKRPLITQFGWQFEKRLFTLSNGLSGVFEFVPLIGGVEQNLFQLSASALVGVRGIGKKQRFEVAIGPNLSKTGMGVVIAAGANFSKENVNFPITLAYVPTVGNKDMFTGKTYYTGHRISLLVGFNYRKK